MLVEGVGVCVMIGNCWVVEGGEVVDLVVFV